MKRRRMKSPRPWTRNPSLHARTEINNQSANHEQNQLSGNSGNPFKSQATQWNKKHEKNCTIREGRTAFFCLHQSSHHPSRHYSEPRGNFPARENPPHPSSLSPIQRPAKLDLWILLGLRKNSRGSQYQPSGRNNTVPRGCSADNSGSVCH